MSATPPTEAELDALEARHQCVPKRNSHNVCDWCTIWNEYNEEVAAPYPCEVSRLIAAYRDALAENKALRFQLARKTVAALPMAGVDVTELIDKLETNNKALREALGKVLPRCCSASDTDKMVECGEVGVWEWGDHDGVEWKCDQHKNDNSYRYGPTLDENHAEARALLTPTSQPESEQLAEGESAEGS